MVEIDNSSDKPQPPSKPQPKSQKKKPLSQIQEEDEEDELPGRPASRRNADHLHLDSEEEEDDPLEKSKKASK